jgi:hypothetical protein
MITTRQVIPLRPRHPTLAALTPRQLLQSSEQFFDMPTHVAGVFRHLRGHSLIEVIGNDPVTVAYHQLLRKIFPQPAGPGNFLIENSPQGIVRHVDHRSAKLAQLVRVVQYRYPMRYVGHGRGYDSADVVHITNIIIAIFDSYVI